MDKYLSLKPTAKKPIKKEEAKKPEAVELDRPLPWVEKYRPRKITDIKHQTEVVKSMHTILQTKNVPHLLFSGPPGTGKTSTILALVKELFGILELNASDERGIAVVREKMKKFAQIKIHPIPNSDAPNLKIVILDEADSMTNDAQSALRRIMENYAATTRFCIICNYLSKIIDPLTSRCIAFRFNPIDETSQIERISYICEQEGYKAEKEAISRIIKQSDGDLRNAIVTLQYMAKLAAALNGSLISENIFKEFAGEDNTDIAVELLTACKANDFKSALEIVQGIYYEGYDCGEVLSQIVKGLAENDEDVFSDLTEFQRARLGQLAAETELCLVKGKESKYDRRRR